MIGEIAGVATAVVLVSFLGVVVWAWGSGRRAEFERAALMPLDDLAGSAGAIGEQKS